MADNKNGHSYGRLEAQPARDDRNHQQKQNQSETEQNALACDSAVRARQQRADAEIRREKRWERWRARETVIVRRVSAHQPGPQDARDHRGEVA